MALLCKRSCIGLLLFLFIFTGCGSTVNPNKLDTPTELKIIDDHLMWESVPSCWSYAIEFDYHDPEKSTGNDTSPYNHYSLIGISACTIRVRALAGSYGTDSDWSRPIEYAGYVAPRIEHTIAINYNGGTGDVTEITVIVGEPFGDALPAAVWKGHTFTVWRVNTNYSGTTVTAESLVTRDITTLFATWDTVRYTVNFDLQGGTGTADAKLVYFGGEYGILPAGITKPGCRFDGWQTEDGEIVTARTIYANDSGITLYAIWTKYYTITFNSAPGSGGSSSVATAVFGETVPAYIGTASTSRLSAPSRRGYIFVGYFAEPNGAGKQYYSLSSYLYLGVMDAWDIEGDAALYAHYTAREYDVTLDVQGGTGGDTQVKAVYDRLLPDAAAPVREGYTFDGYYTAINGGGTPYYDKDMVGGIWQETDPKLYAKWVANKYRITCMMYDGTEDVSTVTFGAAFTLSAAYRAGYNFTGWFAEIGGAGTPYTNNYGGSIRNYNVPYDITVYPGWAARSYTVTLSTDGNAVSAPMVSFDLNGAAGTAPAPQTVSATLGLTYPALPERTGYMFAGWYDNAACAGAPFDFTAAVSVNTTLYSKWVDLSGMNLFPSGEWNRYEWKTGDLPQGAYYAYVPLVTQTVRVSWFINRSHSYINYQRVDILQEDRVLLSLQAANGSGDNNPNRPTSWDINVTAGIPVYIFLDLYGGAAYNPNDKNNHVYFGITPMDTLPSAGGKAAPHKTVTAVYDAPMPEAGLAPPIRGDYTFGGYFTQKDGAGVQYYDQDMKSVRDCDITQNIILYAYWIPI